MVEWLVLALQRPISEVRLESYRPKAGTDFAMITNYFFNVELSEALYPSLQAFEISLRNSVDTALGNNFSDPYWFDTPGLLPHWQQGEVSKARASLARSNKPQEPGRIVAALNFGFWHSLFNSPFEQVLWRPNKAALLVDVFPQLSRRDRNRQNVYQRINTVRKLRNRVMHFEPIWNRPGLPNDHRLILEAIRWISEDMFITLATYDRFESVFANGRQSLEQRILRQVEKQPPSGERRRREQ